MFVFFASRTIDRIYSLTTYKRSFLSTWRPLKTSCLYVIPDIHGMYYELKLILSRILPLRRTGGCQDMLIFLGDYIDRGIYGPEVIDLVIDIKKKQPEQIICLKGNHELMLYDNITKKTDVDYYKMWMENGGEETLGRYLNRIGSDVQNPYLYDRRRIRDIVPSEHIDFIESLIPYYETDEYIFVHGGCDPNVPLKDQNPSTLCWDRSVFRIVQSRLMNVKCPWNKVVVTGHNSRKDGSIFVHDKFMMLDGSSAEKLYVWELNSRTGFSARKNKKRLVSESII